MKLTRLQVRGFRRLRDLALDLGHDRLLVVGPNEAGKSTLLEALIAGLYGLAPARRGTGHAAALRQVLPWTGEPAALALQVVLDDGRTVELDWDFSAERTRVVDHARGEEITADFATGTHGWLDVGERLLGLPPGVFRQVTCVGEGQLASLTDEDEVRHAVLQLTDAGVDVLVEQAVARLEDAGRQATIPRVNSATRRNELGRALEAAEDELASARKAREDLEVEVAAIRDTEGNLNAVRRDLARILADEERRERERQRLRTEIDRAEGRLAEAELRLAAGAEDGPAASRPANSAWSDAEMESAREHLVAPAVGGGPSLRATVSGWFLAVVGVLMLAAGTVLRLVPLTIGGVVVIGAGVFVLTRGRPGGEAPITVGGRQFGDRQALMVALEDERARRDHAAQLEAVQELRGQLDQLLQMSSKSDDELEMRLKEAEELQVRLQLQLERERASYDRGSQMVPEVAPLEERVAALRDRIERLDGFGAAAAQATAALRGAAEEIRRNYAPRLQEYLGRDLARITGGRYTEAVVNDRFDVLLRAPETGSLVELGQLSRGTQQQVYLLLRLGLLEIMGAGTETLPLFLDDALALADDTRRAELLRVLEAEARQVVYFTAGESGAEAFDERWTRVRLQAPASQAVDAGTGQLPIALVDGPG